MLYTYSKRRKKRSTRQRQRSSDAHLKATTAVHPEGTIKIWDRTQEPTNDFIVPSLFIPIHLICKIKYRLSHCKCVKEVLINCSDYFFILIPNRKDTCIFAVHGIGLERTRYINKKTTVNKNLTSMQTFFR
jgi:hypothetical protein